MTKRTLILGYHLVAFLDVLAQRDALEQLRKMPTTPEERVQTEEALRNTAGFVLDMRELFQSTFAEFEEGASSRMQVHTKQPVRPKLVGFSDSFVMSVALREDRGALVRAVIVFSALSAASVVMLTSLASRHPLRGGIDVGLATEIGPEEIYGTALRNAYLLESQTAGYPRIVVGDELLEYLNIELLRFGQQATPVANAITEIVQKIKQMIVRDKDGENILDYLGPVVANSFSEHAAQLVQPAYDFVLAEQKRLISEGDKKKIDRYLLFREYFESRLTLWGLKAIV